jgi:hypothetical protein
MRGPTEFKAFAERASTLIDDGNTGRMALRAMKTAPRRTPLLALTADSHPSFHG